jgi:hypothetical protein
VFTFLCESVPEENREEVIPPIIKKEGGLIKIFLDKIPCQYGEEVWKGINGHLKKYTILSTFIDDFMKYVTAQYAKSLTAEELHSELPAKKDLPSKGLNRKMSSEEKDEFERKASSFPKRSLHHFAEKADHFIDDLDKEQIMEYARGVNGLESEAPMQSYNEEDQFAAEEEGLKSRAKLPPEDDEMDEENMFDDDEDEHRFNEGLNAMMGGSVGFGASAERKEFGNRFFRAI